MSKQRMKQQAEDRYQELSFTDDFIFWKVMTTRLDLCREVLELIIDRKVLKVEYPEGQKTIDLSAERKSVRLDVYLEGSDEVYNLEMQTTENKSLAKRSRYYQGLIDLNLIEKGAGYNELRQSYVIFICTFDPFKKGIPKYTFENRCRELPDLVLNDGTVKIYVNGTAKGVFGKLGEFIKFLSGEVSGDLSRELEEAVTFVKGNEKFRREYMTLYERDQEKWREGNVEGRIQATVETLLEYGVSKEEIITRLQKKFELSCEEAVEAYDKYSNVIVE